MERAKSHSFIFKCALLSISMLLMAAPNIAAAIPLMSKTFTAQSASAIETISTIPNLGIIVGIFISSILTNFLSQKRTVLFGLMIAFICGIIPAFSNNYYLVLGSRLIFGFGIGLFNSLAISMISDFYSGDELSTMMGFQNAINSLGSSILSFLVGYLITFGWHATFLIYAIALPILILFGLVIPNVQADTAKQVSKPHQKINSAIILISILTFFIYVFFMVVTVKMADLLTYKNIGTASQAATVLGGFTLVGMLASSAYGMIHKVLKELTLPVGFLLMASGFFTISVAVNLIAVISGVVLIGLGFGIVIPYIYTIVNTVAPAGSQNLASSVMLIFTNIGVFLSPTIINFLSKIFGNTQPDTNMRVCAYGFVILFIVAAAMYLYKKLIQGGKEIAK